MKPVSVPRPLARRPLYTVAPDPTGGWRVTARRGRRGRGGFPDRASAEAHAEYLASGHLVAQVRVLAADGSTERDEGVRNEVRCREAEQWLEAFLVPLRDYRHARSLLVDDWHTEDRWVDVAGETVRLHLAIHEGQAWDEIYVQAALFDEPIVPRIAEVGFYLMG